MPTLEETQALEELQAGIRETLLTPEQKQQKRNLPPPAPPNQLDIGIAAFNRGLGTETTRNQQIILSEAIRRGFVIRDQAGKLQVQVTRPESSLAPFGDEQQRQLLEELDLINIPSQGQFEESKRLKAFESRKSFGEQVIEDVKQRPLRTAGLVLSKPAPIATGFFTAAGEAGDQLLQRAGVLEGEAPQTPEEAGNKILGATAEGFGVGTVSKGIGKLVSPFGNTVTPEGRAAIETVRGLKGGKDLVFPAEKAGESGAVDTLGNIAETVMILGAKKFRQTANINKAIDDAIKDTTLQLTQGKTTEQISDIVSLIITNGKKIYGKVRSGLFDSIDALNPTIIKVSTQKGFKTKTLEDGTEELISKMNPTTGLIENIPNIETKEIITKGGIDLTPIIVFLRKALSREEDPLNKLPEATKNLRLLEGGSPIVSFKQADNIVKDMADFGFSSLISTTKDQGIAKVGQKMIKVAMDKAAKELPKEAFKQFKIAKRFSQIEQTTYQRTLIKKMLKDSKDFTPEQVFNTIKNAGPENIKLIRELMQPQLFIQKSLGKARGIKSPSTSINENTFWRSVQGKFLEDMVKTKTGDVSQKTIINKIDEAILSGRFKEMFPGPRGRLAAENFKRLAEAKNVILTPNPTGRAGLMVKVGQPTALLTMGGGLVTALAGSPETGAQIAGGGLALFLLPEALASLILSRRLSKWLINQSVLRPAIEKGTQTTLSLANVLQREKINFEFFVPDQQSEIPIIAGQ